MTPTWQTADGSIRLFLGDCLDVLPQLASERCGACGHDWSLHLNTNACCQVIGKDESSGIFEGATRYCLCDELPTAKVDAVVTDPPYDMNIERVPLGGPVGKHSRWNESRAIGKQWAVNYAWLELAQKLQPAHWVVFCGQRDIGKLYAAIEPVAKIQTLFTWLKPNAPQMTRPVPRADTEFILWARAEDSTCELMGEFGSSVLTIPMAYAGIGGGERVRTCHNGPAAHPCQKPVACVLPFIELLQQRTILDPFMGSGTTGVACIRTGRKFIGIEREPKYFEIAVKRIEAELNSAPLFEPKPQIVQREIFT